VEIDHLETDEVVQNVEDWLSTAETPEPQATEAREMLREDVEEDLSGTRPFWRDDELYFSQQTAIVAGRAFSSSPRPVEDHHCKEATTTR